VLLSVECFNDAIGRKGRGTTMRVMNDSDVFEAKQMLRNCDRSKRIVRSTAGHNNRKDVGGRSYLLAMVIDDDVAWKNLTKSLGDHLWDTSSTRVVTVNYNRLQRHCLSERFPNRGFVERRVCAEREPVEFAHSPNLLESWSKSEFRARQTGGG